VNVVQQLRLERDKRIAERNDGSVFRVLVVRACKQSRGIFNDCFFNAEVNFGFNTWWSEVHAVVVANRHAVQSKFDLSSSKVATKQKNNTGKGLRPHHIALVLRRHQPRRNFVSGIVVKELEHIHHGFKQLHRNVTISSHAIIIKHNKPTCLALSDRVWPGESRENVCGSLNAV
jgi:hypothetical protein